MSGHIYNYVDSSVVQIVAFMSREVVIVRLFWLYLVGSLAWFCITIMSVLALVCTGNEQKAVPDIERLL